MTEPAPAVAPRPDAPRPASARAPDELDRLWSGFARAVHAPLDQPSRATAVAAVAVCLGVLLLGSSPALFVNDMPDDALIPLDGAWRMSLGQRPHVDFMTPVGDLYYWLLALAAWVTGPQDPRLLAVANALVGVPALVMAWIATRDRLSAPLRGAVLVAVSFCAMSPRTLDSPSLVGFNAMYNRWSWALAFIALCALLLPTDCRDRRRWVVEAGLVALCVWLVFWLKVTFLALIGAGALISWVCIPENRRLAWGVGAGLAAVALTAALPVGAAYLGDLAIVAEAAAGGPGLLRTSRLQPLMSMNLVEISLVVVMALALMRTATTEEQPGSSRTVLAMIGVVGAGLLVGSQNNDSTVPVLSLALLLGASRFRARGPRGAQAVLAAALAFAVVARPVAYDAGAILIHAVKSRTASASLFPVGPLARLRIPSADDVGMSEAGMVGQVVSGRIPGDVYDNLRMIPWPVDNPVILAAAVQLLEAHGVRDRRVASLTFSPYFPYLLGTTPPRGLPAWWDWQRTFGETWHERACDALADAEVVLEPRVWSITGIGEQNHPCLQAAFHRVEEGPLWTLWVRGAAP